MKNRGQYWNLSKLRARGWTNALRKELLPAPRFFFRNGHRSPVWNRDDVLAAEQKPRFFEENAGKASPQRR